METNEINKLAEASFEIALLRGKTGINVSKWYDYLWIKEELEEFLLADEHKASEHIDATEAVEELADIALAALTELRKRNVDVAAILWAKTKYNKTRIKPDREELQARISQYEEFIAKMERDDHCRACEKQQLYKKEDRK